MKFITKEFTIELLKDNIVTYKVNDGCTELTFEGATQAVEKINLLVALDDKPTKIISYLAPFYVKKELMNYLTTSIPESIEFIALVCPGYISKYVASIAIKMHKRFYQNEDDLTEIQIFLKKDKAVEWLVSV
ncbi:MAG: Unknown protein [uncultured Aureispira sp.]|uniref:STAS/SEC14 domain-containing protein n=1 Tax=uncultured Aureispira sp. TaxID=1331704 RepID=A0A6S6UDK1_9BACT|nr:MAG: Unknown protein [uncultured Aureispira sp.]